MSCSRAEPETALHAAGPCETSPDPDGLHCRLSTLALVANPARYDGKSLSIKGFLSKGRYPVLFANREAAEFSILENGVRIDDPSKLLEKAANQRPDGYVRLTGTFKYEGAKTAGATPSGGAIGSLHLKSVSSEDEDAWWCSDKVERSLYRSYPCQNAEQLRSAPKP